MGALKKNKKISKPRQTNLELLRIISMIMIIFIHSMGHTGIQEAVQAGSLKYYMVWIIIGTCQVSVNCYVLISGYFLIKSHFRVKKLIMLLLEVFFYSVVIYLVFLYKGGAVWDFKTCTTVFLPTLMREYWFVTTYVGLYIISPFLNLAVNGMSQARHLGLVVAGFILLSVWSNIFFTSDTLNTGGGYGYLWFMYLYIVAAYFRLYYVPGKGKFKKPLLVFAVFTVLTPVCEFVMQILTSSGAFNFLSSDFLASQHKAMYRYNSIFIFISTIAFFALFLNVHIKNKVINKIILFLSPCTLGVYLIHDNPYIRQYMWTKLNLIQYLWEWYFPLVLVGAVLAIYLCASIGDKIRILLFIPLNKSKLFDKWCTHLTAIPSRFCKKFHI